MKKILIIICLLVLSGCSQTFGGGETIADNLKLKASTDKILSHEEIIIPEQKLIATSTGKTTIIPAESLVEYTYVSDIKIGQTEYNFEGKQINEIVELRDVKYQVYDSGEIENGRKKYVMVSPPPEDFTKNNGEWFKVKSATTTKAAWDEQNKVSFFQIIKEALADTDTSSTNNGDNFMLLAAPAENDSAELNIVMSTYTTSALTYPIISWTLPAGSGNISDVKMFLYKYGHVSGLDRTMNLHKILRTDTVISQSSWNSYKTGSNWTTAGANGDGTDYDSTVIDTTNYNVAINSWVALGLMGATSDNPLTLNWNDTVILTMKPAIVQSDSDEEYFRSKEYSTDTTKRPYLEITYTVSSCSYSGSGNYNVLLTDNCYITSTVYVNGEFNLIGNTDGTGSFGCAPGVKVSATAYNLGTGKTHLDLDCFAHH